MNKKQRSFAKKTTKNLTALIFALVFTLPLAINGQNTKPKKWTYDFSETVKFFDTPLAACQSYVREKYPNDSYKAVIEATNNPEIYRCSADETYFGVVYQRECQSCSEKPASRDEQSLED